MGVGTERSEEAGEEASKQDKVETEVGNQPS